MTPKDLKDLLRYCLKQIKSRYPDLKVDIKSQSFGIEYILGEGWKSTKASDGSLNPICPLSTILLIQNPESNDDLIFESDIREFIQTYLQLPSDFIYSFWNGLANIPSPENVIGFEVGSYIRNRISDI